MSDRQPRRLSEMNATVPRVQPRALVDAGLGTGEPLEHDGAAGVPAAHPTARVATPTQHTRPESNRPPTHPGGKPFSFDGR